MKTIAVLVFGIAVLVVSAGGYALSSSQLTDLPANPRDTALRAERENLEEIRGMTVYGLIAGVAMTAASGAVLGWRLWRDNRS